jgi:hypothetical protein
MPLPIDCSKISFYAGNDPNPVKVHNTEDQRVKDGKPVFDTNVVAFFEVGDAEVIKVRMAGAPVGLKKNQPIKITGLDVRPWEMDNRAGLTYWATAIEPASGSGKS